jgi:hypothetical protein
MENDFSHRLSRQSGLDSADEKQHLSNAVRRASHNASERQRRDKLFLVRRAVICPETLAQRVRAGPRFLIAQSRWSAPPVKERNPGILYRVHPKFSQPCIAATTGLARRERVTSPRGE